MNRKNTASERSLRELYAGSVPQGRPLLFLDFDDTLCLNRPYGGYDVFSTPRPADLWSRLFSDLPKRVLLGVVQQLQPSVVLTTSWLRLGDRAAFESILHLTGLADVSACLHERWDAPQARGATRWQAVEAWLTAHYRGGPVAVLDDDFSGTGLMASPLARLGRVILCEQGIGLTEALGDRLRAALASQSVAGDERLDPTT